MTQRFLSYKFTRTRQNHQKCLSLLDNILAKIPTLFTTLRYKNPLKSFRTELTAMEDIKNLRFHLKNISDFTMHQVVNFETWKEGSVWVGRRDHPIPRGHNGLQIYYSNVYTGRSQTQSPWQWDHCDCDLHPFINT